MATDVEEPTRYLGRRLGRIPRRTVELLERAQDAVTFAAGGALVLLAGALLVAAIVDLFSEAPHSVSGASTHFLDRILLVLILVEVVHTIVLSLRTHALQPEPFIVVGLIAVVRKILLVLAGAASESVSTLGLLVAMLAAFVAGLVALRVFRRRVAAEEDV